MKFVLQDMELTQSFEAPVFVTDKSPLASPHNVTPRSRDARRYKRDEAIEIQNRSRGRYRALPEIAPIVEENS